MSLNYTNYYGASCDSPFDLRPLPPSQFEANCGNMQTLSGVYDLLGTLIDHILELKRRPSGNTASNLIGAAHNVFSQFSRGEVHSAADCGPLLDAADALIDVWRTGTGAGRTHAPGYKLKPGFKAALGELEFQTRALAGAHAALRDQWHKHHLDRQVVQVHVAPPAVPAQ